VHGGSLWCGDRAESQRLEEGIRSRRDALSSLKEAMGLALEDLEGVKDSLGQGGSLEELAGAGGERDALSAKLKAAEASLKAVEAERDALLETAEASLKAAQAERDALSAGLSEAGACLCDRDAVIQAMTDRIGALSIALSRREHLCTPRALEHLMGAPILEQQSLQNSRKRRPVPSRSTISSL
jgi:chromosome segregation ATPase